MQLTVEQTLQQGVAAQKEGKLQEAERLYRSIIQSQPSHPLANHNLGVLTVSVKKVDAALPLFKAALEANPKVEQFWFSYIDALIMAKKIDDARRLIEKAKKQSIDADRLSFLEAQLSPKIQNPNTLRLRPPQELLNKLIEHYQKKRFTDAEKLATSISQEFPRHNFSWKILGAVFKATGRKFKALDANKTSVTLSPQDAEAHYNLGNTLKELGRLEDAVVSYNQAIELKPDLFQTHYNLGNTLKELGRLEDAVVSYNQAITLKADYSEAHSNLGNTLQELGRLDESEANYTQAILLKPDYAEAHFNLGNTLKELGRLEDAVVSYNQAIELNPDLAEAHYNLGVLLFESGKYNQAEKHFRLFDNHKSKLYAIKCSYLLDGETRFYEKFDLLVNQGEINAVMGSLAFHSEFKYGIKKSNPFCNDPLSYVVKTDLNTLYDFENIFIETARSVLSDNSVSYKAQGRLTNGIQTAGNIFVHEKVLKTEIEKIIHTEIRKYQIQFKDSEEGFIKNWPTSYEIKGWLVCMQSGGKLAPHMHGSGWITGSIYINVPPKSNTDCGNLVLCLSDQEHVLVEEKNQQSIIDVMTGSLCLFPSSLHHYTIPFEEKEDRIVLAFDVIPKDKAINL